MIDWGGAEEGDGWDFDDIYHGVEKEGNYGDDGDDDGDRDGGWWVLVEMEEEMQRGRWLVGIEGGSWWWLWLWLWWLMLSAAMGEKEEAEMTDTQTRHNPSN